MKAQAYLLHTRPQSYPVTFFAAFTGYAISPAKPETAGGLALDLGLLLLLFSVLLWGGTNAFNSSQDGNDGPLTLLPEPPPVPRFLNSFGLLLMLLAVLLAGLVSTRLLLWTAVGLLLSVWYSWKNPYFRRGKDIPVMDMLINTVGFGFCSILFGYFLTNAPLTPELLFIGIGFTFAYLGGMPTSQIFQLKEKTERNYTSLFGPATILKMGAVFFVLHLAFLAVFSADIVFLQANMLALACWLGWGILVLASAVHSFWWSKEPYTNPYNRMNRQMVMMMLSQVLWTSYAWMRS
ncbi:MAG TPA: hypothetical protein VK927_10225 [Adhaeribacter sp.]|nr:hypothetical protein [Adhaeribacter sp.]